MERLWLRHYPPGVPADIDPSRYPSLVAMLEEGFKAYAERDGCLCIGKALTHRELEFQLTDAGAEAIIVLENFAAVLQQALPSTPVKHIVVATLGDMLGSVKGTLVNAVVRYIKRMVPAYAIPSAIRFNDVLAAGRKSGFKTAVIDSSDVAVRQ